MKREDYELVSGSPTDDDFEYRHLDDPRINDLPIEGEDEDPAF